jgi:hypothetical protein
MFKHPSTRKLTALALAVALSVAAAGPALAGPLVPERDGHAFASRLLAWAIAWVEESPFGRWLARPGDEAIKISPSHDPDGLAPIDPSISDSQRPTANLANEN